MAALSLSFVFVVSQLGTTTASPPRGISPGGSILPASVGSGIATNSPVVLSFDEAPDQVWVEANLAVLPRAAVELTWTGDGSRLVVAPRTRWLADARYLITIGHGAVDESELPAGEPLRFSFTTQTAPRVDAFRVDFPSDFGSTRVDDPPGMKRTTDALVLDNTPVQDAVDEVSVGTAIAIGFTEAMDRSDVERHFLISPQVDGAFRWRGTTLTFTPTERLRANARYAITLSGAHDRIGNRLDGDVSFSFTTRTGAQVVRTTPKAGATNVGNGPMTIWFTQPMNRVPTEKALRVTDLTAGTPLAGTASWNADSTQLRFDAKAALPKGHRIEVRIGKRARDADGNRFAAAWAFTTAAPAQSFVAPTTRSPVTGPPPPADAAEYALWQINKARAQYGIAPLRLDAAVSAVASAHAWDMINHGYFSHIGRDGSRISDRLRRAGVSFSYSGENICYYNGLGLTAMLNWCHGVFMSEPYPGYANHIGNILGRDYNRLGMGIARSGSRVIIVWDFAG